MIERPAIRPEAIPDHLQISVQRVDESAEPSALELKQYLGATDSREIIKPHLLRRVWHLAGQLAQGLDPGLSRGLVFARTRRNTGRYAEVLRRFLKHLGKPLAVESFHAGLSSDERLDLYERFLGGEIQVLVATKAFGMGMDIPNIHFLAHLDLPATLEDYLQEIGRAGRDRHRLAAAGFTAEHPIQCLLYYSPAEIKDTRRFLRRNRLNWRDLQRVLSALMDFSGKLHGSPRTGRMIVPLSAADLMPLSHLDDNGLRMALHWLERLKRITLGHFFPPYLMFRIGSTLPDGGPEPLMALAREVRRQAAGRDVQQVNTTDLQRAARLENPDDLFRLVQQGESHGLFRMENTVLLRLDSQFSADELKWCADNSRLPYAVSARIGLCMELAHELKTRDLSYTRDQLKERIDQYVKGGIHEESLGWFLGQRSRELERRKQDWTLRQIRSLPLQLGPLLRILRQNRAMHVETVLDGELGITIVFATRVGGLEKNLPMLETHCRKLLVLAVAMNETRHPLRLSEVLDQVGCSMGELENAASLLCACGILHNDSLLSRSIELDLLNTQRLDQPLPGDAPVEQEFKDHRRLGELRLASLDLVAHLDAIAQRGLFRQFFCCNSPTDLQQRLEGYLKNPHNIQRWQEDGFHGEIESLLRNVSDELLAGELNRLSAEQRQAVRHAPARSLIVNAGPGSGKTHVLVMRCAWLLLDERVRPEDLLLLSYNRAVAFELRLRLRSLFEELGIRGEAERVPVYTLHGFATHILGSQTRFLTEERWNRLVAELVADGLRLEDAALKARRIRRPDPDKPEQLIDGVQPPLDMWIPWATRHLVNHPGIAYGKHILLDEMQDLTRERLALLRVLLAKPEATLFAVGDPDQSIYGYERKKAGDPSDPRKLLDQLAALEPGGNTPERASLRMNYRSRRAIVDEAARRLNPGGSVSRQITRHEGEAVRLKGLDRKSAYAVTDALYGVIQDWMRKTNTRRKPIPSDDKPSPVYRLAVLFRTNAELAEVDSARRGDNRFLNLERMPSGVSIGTDQIFEQFRLTREWLEMRTGLESLPDVVERDTLETWLLNSSRRAEGDLKPWNRHVLSAGRHLIRILAAAQGDRFLRDDLMQDLDEAVQDSAAIQRVIAVGRESLRSRLKKNPDQGVDRIPRLRITLGTIHKAKGLEFDEVLLAASRLDLDSDPDTLAEERRVIYVACTRARQRLTLIEGPREIALRDGRPFISPQDLAPVLIDLEDVYLNAMVHSNRFPSEAALVANQRLIHQGLRHGEELLLVGKTVLRRTTEGPGQVVAILSNRFQKKVQAYCQRNALSEDTPLAGLHVGAILRRELEPENQEYTPHPHIVNQGFFWMVQPYGVLRPLRDHERM